MISIKISSSWWPNDINNTEGTRLFAQTSSDGLQQLINEPTHIQRNSSSSIDLIFPDQPNMYVNYGVHASLHPNCHQQIVHENFNLHITNPHHINVRYRITKRLIHPILEKRLT